MNTENSERYLVISADCHGGGSLLGYKPFLSREYHDEFDAWASTYVIDFDDLVSEDADRNWDSDRRLAELERDGIVAEVIYPNTIPPFFPKASLTAIPPARDRADYQRRWAGLQAHNRWLAEFCAATPGRRAGIAQIMLEDIDAAVAEVRWAHGAGLTGGVLLPGVPPGHLVPQLHVADYYEPLFAVCDELGMPVNHHGGSATPPMGDTPDAKVIFLLETTWFSHRALVHLLVSGVMERHPSLRFVFTEQGTAWIPDELMRLDYFFNRMATAVGAQEYEWGKPVMDTLSLKPSEYWARQCHVGASFIRPTEVPLRHAVGLDRVMWGSDYPHKEGTAPYTMEALRASFAGVPHDETAMLLGGNAARVYGFDRELLDPIAARVGPMAAEIDVPLQRGAVPMYAEKCPALFGFGSADFQPTTKGF